MVNIVHGFSSAIADDPSASAAGKVLPSHWNAGHTITMAASSRIAGRATSGAGAIEELTISQVLDFLSSTEGAIPIRGASTWGTTVQPTAIPAGCILPYGGATEPTGYLFCDGDAISRTTYSDLFAVIGTAYGTGDGSTTFNLPDLRGRFPVGQDDMGGSAASRLTTGLGGIDGATLGASGGTSTKTLTTTELPAHTHTGTTSTASDHTHTGSTSSGGSHSHYVVDGTVSATGSGAAGTTDPIDFQNGPNTPLPNRSVGGTADSYKTNTDGAHTHSFTTAAGGTHNHTFTTASAGSGSAFNIMNPCQVVNYIIKT